MSKKKYHLLPFIAVGFSFLAGVALSQVVSSLTTNSVLKRFQESDAAILHRLQETLSNERLGILGGLILPRLVGNSLETKRNACYVNVRNIEVQTELWYRSKGAWPAVDLSDVGSDKAYFPEGLPTCPITKSGYVLDETTHRVLGHQH